MAVDGGFLLFSSAGGPGLGIRGDGFGPIVPVDLLAGFDYRYVCHSVRGAVPLRRHRADR